MVCCTYLLSQMAACIASKRHTQDRNVEVRTELCFLRLPMPPSLILSRGTDFFFLVLLRLDRSPSTSHHNRNKGMKQLHQTNEKNEVYWDAVYLHTPKTEK